ncbi:MAG: tetratricopeptide repeat protein [Vicinamibacterales bacterium]
MIDSGAEVLEFREFRLDIPGRRLWRKQDPVALQPKAFDLLAYLATHRERVVPKDELFSALWPDTFVQDANLPQTVSVLRRALGESSQDNAVIATVPRRGYKFVAPVRAIAEDREGRARAADLCVRGRHQLNRRLTDSLSAAITLFLASTDADPTYAPAWVGLADSYALLSLYGASMPRDAFPRSKAAALTALSHDPGLAPAHNALGVVALFYEWDWTAAEQAFTRAIALDPVYGEAHQRLGMYLTAQQRFAEAREVLERAQALDPLSRIIATMAGYPAYYAGDYEAAARQFRQVLQLDPNFSMAHFRLGLALAQQHRFTEALAELGIAKALSDDRDVVAALGQVHGMMGHRDEALAAIAELEARSKAGFVPSYAVAVVHAALGDTEAALDWLARAVEERSYWVMYFNVDPALASLRGHARFDDLRAQAGLLAPAR